MNRLFKTSDSAAVAVATAAAALAFPPVAGQLAYVAALWNGDAGCVAAFDLQLWGAAALTLTSSELFGAVPRALALAGVTVTAANVDSGAANDFTHVAHGLKTGDGPARWTSTATLPAGLALATDYWVIYETADKFKVATSLANALAGTAVDITDAGTALSTHTLTVTASATRLRWESRGLLDTSISLDVDRGYVIRCEHSPDVIAYGVIGTLSASTVTGIVRPVEEV